MNMGVIGLGVVLRLEEWLKVYRERLDLALCKAASHHFSVW